MKLCVNIDHVATLRQVRRADEPDPIWAASEVLLGGADGVTFHLREDRRHIGDRDARLLKSVVVGKLNMEMSIAAEIVGIACALKPDQCTLVPEKRKELTTEGGLNVVANKSRVRDTVAKLHDAGIFVSAFIEPAERQVDACADCEFDAIELWTGGYAEAATQEDVESALAMLEEAAGVGHECGLEVYAGHGLTYRNIAPVVETGVFSEFNIGHSIVARSVFVGLREAVREMKNLIREHKPFTSPGMASLATLVARLFESGLGDDDALYDDECDLVSDEPDDDTEDTIPFDGGPKQS